jgi:hypothetical protein
MATDALIDAVTSVSTISNKLARRHPKWEDTWWQKAQSPSPCSKGIPHWWAHEHLHVHSTLNDALLLAKMQANSFVRLVA